MDLSRETRFADSDGVYIAYQVLGSGDLDILVFNGSVLPMESFDDEPSLARFQRRLEPFGRLIRFDVRGVGMSDPISPSAPPTLEQWAHDAAAVLDTVGSEQAAVFAPGTRRCRPCCWRPRSPAGCPASSSSMARPGWLGTTTTRWGSRRAILDRFLEVNIDPNAGRARLRLPGHRRAEQGGRPGVPPWWVRAGNRGASPAAARACSR